DVGHLYADLARDEPGGMLAAATARAEAQCLRLAVTYALLDGERAIAPAHLDAAHAVWHYARASSSRLFSGKVGDPTADRILTALRDAAPEGLDRSALHRLFGRHAKGDVLDRVLGDLASRELVETVDEPTDGRPRTVTYATQPSVALRTKR
nr:hypothetical protein [Myxococcota bacterium]